MMKYCIVAFVSLVPSAGAAVHVRGSAMHLMQAPMDQVGSRLVSANLAVAQSAARGGGEAAYDAMVHQIDATRTVPANPAVTAVTEKANRMFESLHPGDPLCTRDWAGCPDGWSLSFESCIAPPSYTGPCANILHLGGGVDKRKFANDCGAPWPCAGECVDGHDYDNSFCPVGWTNRGDYCESAGAVATDQCNSKYIFASINTEMKQGLALLCGHKWPCLSQCESEYTASCPQGWSLDAAGVKCVAPASYAGECPYNVDLSGFSRDEKEAFAQACTAPFPCSRDGGFVVGPSAVVGIRDGAINSTGAIR